MPNWVKDPDDWELYEEDMLELSRFWYDDWVDKIEFDAANNNA
jgi:hypothetical protein